MKKIVLATTLLALGSASAFAADLSERGMYAKAPVAAPVANWSGLFIGGNVGYGWGIGKTSVEPINSSIEALTTVFPPTTLDTKPKGVIGGAQIGYNWQIGTIVAGLEADIQGSGIKGSATQTPIVFASTNFNGSFATVDQKLSWFGTVRGRLGVTAMPDLLLYTTGGLAYGQIDASGFTRVGNAPNVDYPTSIGQTKVGWALGAGAEWAFTRNWTAKLEYLHVDLGKTSTSANAVTTDNDFSGTAVVYTWRMRENIVRAGVNYHFN